ncbi:MAG TPA: hypothetical protein VEC75_09665, partial [Stellaceae bacterium]|nr:hypothetical protein [Stellaceae bacterium]
MAENPTQRLGHARRRIRNIGLTLLLAFELLVFFVLVPITGLALFSPPSTMIIGATLVVIAAVVSIAQNRVVLVVTLVTAACALFADFYRVEWPSRFSDTAFLLIALVFFVVLTGSVSFLVFRQGRITPHRVTGAIVIYLHVAVIFTYLYAIVLIFAPGAL